MVMRRLTPSMFQVPRLLAPPHPEAVLARRHVDVGGRLAVPEVFAPTLVVTFEHELDLICSGVREVETGDREGEHVLVVRQP